MRDRFGIMFALALGVPGSMARGQEPAAATPLGEAGPDRPATAPRKPVGDPGAAEAARARLLAVERLLAPYRSRRRRARERDKARPRRRINAALREVYKSPASA